MISTADITPMKATEKFSRVVKLKDIAKISSGTTPLRSESRFHVGGSIPWVKTTDLNNGEILETEELVTESALQETSLKIFPKGTVLVAMYGGFNQIGRTGILGINATINQALSALTVNEKEVDPKYLLHWLNANVGYWKNLAGSSRKDPNITSKDVGDFPFLMIPLSQQSFIASVLSKSDLAIARIQDLIAKKEMFKKGLMRRLLTEGGRLPGFFKEWTALKMDTLFDRVTRKNQVGCKEVVTISGRQGFVSQLDYFNKNIASEVLDDYFLIREGEFCYNKSYSNGYPWGAIKRLHGHMEAVVTSLYICFRMKDDSEIDLDFMEYFFESGGLNRGLMRIAHEGGRAHGLLNVTPSDFFELPISVPERDEQKAIARILKTCDQEIQLLTAKAEKIRELKKGLMQVLLTGKKRLKEFRV